MPQKFASIDIGSNSTLLLILELGDNDMAHVVIDTKTSTKLSTGAHLSGSIADSALDRQFAALDRFQAIIRENGVEKIVACGTQVFRVATNGRQVAEEITRRYGWKMEIITGEREAELSYRAATTGLKNVPESRIVIDVGGGSSEVILGNGDKIVSSRSFPVGAVNITERFGLGGRTTSEMIGEAEDYLDQIFADGPFPMAMQGVESEVFAVGGTAVTLAAVKAGLKQFEPRRVHGVQLDSNWISKTIVELGSLDLAQRKELMPFDPDRAEIIVGGAIIIGRLLLQLGQSKLTASNFGLRWGLITATFPPLARAEIEQYRAQDRP